MSIEGAGRATGRTEAHGHHTAIVLAEREAVEVEPGRLVTVAAGFFLVSEDDRGFVWATSFGSEMDLDAAFTVEDRRFDEWLEINEPG